MIDSNTLEKLRESSEKRLELMNTNKLKARTMKNKLIVLVMAIMLVPLAGMAQKNIFEKYSDDADVTYVSIKPKMFQMIAKMGINVEDAEAKA